MIKPAGSPWLNMQKDTSRRVDIDTLFNFFWITDQKGHYGLLITFEFVLDNITIEDKIKGISVVKSIEGLLGKLYFVLNNNNDWELFLSVCTDLISTANICENELSMVAALNKRIRRWQKFLSAEASISLPEILQMGMLTELNFLLNSLTPTIGYKKAIESWVGPDADKKDFSLDEIFVEIKSFISSKGPTIKISSLHQLEFEIKPLYLVTYALTKSEKGITIIDLIEQINELIPENDPDTKKAFENQLNACGYFADITEAPFYSFNIDAVKTYFVSEQFPKILSGNIDDRIETVQYSIDLAKCSIFIKDLPLNKIL